MNKTEILGLHDFLTDNSYQGLRRRLGAMYTISAEKDAIIRKLEKELAEIKKLVKYCSECDSVSNCEFIIDNDNDLCCAHDRDVPINKSCSECYDLIIGVHL